MVVVFDSYVYFLLLPPWFAPFQATGLFRYPPKTSENLWSLIVLIFLNKNEGATEYLDLINLDD